MFLIRQLKYSLMKYLANLSQQILLAALSVEDKAIRFNLLEQMIFAFLLKIALTIKNVIQKGKL